MVTGLEVVVSAHKGWEGEVYFPVCHTREHKSHTLRKGAAIVHSKWV